MVDSRQSLVSTPIQVRSTLTLPTDLPLLMNTSETFCIESMHNALAIQIQDRITSVELRAHIDEQIEAARNV